MSSQAPGPDDFQIVATFPGFAGELIVVEVLGRAVKVHTSGNLTRQELQEAMVMMVRFQKSSRDRALERSARMSSPPEKKPEK